MSTTPSTPPPASPTPHESHDHHTGAFGFFRKHQKAILYSAGLFALITFSVTGAMLGFVDQLFGRGPKPDPATIKVKGNEVHFTLEDSDVARALQQHRVALRPALPDGLVFSEANDGDRNDAFMVLRRVAIEEGIDVSMAEVDRAIEWLRERNKHVSATQTALQSGMASLADYRRLMKEAMRIGTIVRLQTLAADASDSNLVASLLEGKEKITVRTAMFDAKALAEQLKKDAPVTEDDLKKWLDGKNEQQKNMMGALDTNKVSLLVGTVLHDQFDPAEWQEELKDWKGADDQMAALYEELKDPRFKVEGKEGEFQKPEDQAVKDVLTKVAKAGEVMNQVQKKIVTAFEAAMKPVEDEFNKCTQEKNAAFGMVQAAKATVTKAPELPDAKEELRKAEELMTQRESALKAAEDIVKAMRAEFDFKKAFTEATTGKKGFEVKELKGPKNGDDLKNLDEIGLGEWKFPTAQWLQNKGEISRQVARTAKGSFLFQVTELEVRPLKAWDKLKPILDGAYYEELAKKRAEDAKTKLDEAALRLAKAKISEKVIEIDGKRTVEVDKRLAEWEKTTGTEMAAAEEQLKPLAPGSQAQKAWSRKRDLLAAQLGAKEDKRKEIDTAVGKELEAETKTEAKKKYGEVLEAAATEAGFTLVALPTLRRDVNTTPRFDKRYDLNVTFLFQGRVNDLKAGDATDVLEDPTNRRWHLAVCDQVAPIEAADLTRREFETGRHDYENRQSQRAQVQAFTIKALEQRYTFTRPKAAQ